MDVRWRKLEVNVGAVHKLLKCCGCFVVEALELGAEAPGG